MKMEILELPQDLIWDGDQSPTLSPGHLSDASAETLIFEDSFATELIPNDDLIKPIQTIEFCPEVFEQLLDIQEEFLENMDQTNDQWLDQPIIPSLDEYAPVPDARIYPVKVNTAQLLNEFNQVYDAVELTHLTPPETPPHSPTQTPLPAYLNYDSKNQFYQQQPITSYQLQPNQQFQQCKEEKPMIVNYAPVMPAQQFPSILEQAINLVQQTSPQIEYTENFDDAMAEVEALVRSRAEDFADSSSIDDDSSMSGSSTCFSPRSEASSSITDDSDWTMKSSSTIATALKNKQATQKRKPRINRRSPEDRQSRKKEQNKSAANRYRLKKKAEIEILLDEERDLIKRNETLQSQYEEVGREVRYIKSLLRELFKAKGLMD